MPLVTSTFWGSIIPMRGSRLREVDATPSHHGHISYVISLVLQILCFTLADVQGEGF